MTREEKGVAQADTTAYSEIRDDLRKIVRSAVDSALEACTARCLDNLRDRQAVAREVMKELNPFVTTIAGVETILAVMRNEPSLAHQVVVDGFLPRNHAAIEETTDKYGRHWDFPHDELCPECGQPDSCGDCDHNKLLDKEVLELGGRL